MGEKRKSPLHFLVKKWDLLFAEDRKPKREVVPYAQWKREIKAPGDHLDHFFLRQSEDPGLACGFDNVKLFCEGACLETLKSGAGDAGKRRGAILDEKSCTGSGPSNAPIRAIYQWESPINECTSHWPMGGSLAYRRSH
jgi:hypothetical protein